MQRRPGRCAVPRGRYRFPLRHRPLL